MNEERSSDPFPFLKIHRTVEALAEAMATGFHMPVEKAGWGLMRFWRRCADPREIEAAYDRGDRWVFLDDATLTRRLLLTFGEDLDHHLLAEAGVVEQVDGKWRVKGTSDYFKIIGEARRNAANGSKGGLKAAAKKTSPPQAGVQPPLDPPSLFPLEMGSPPEPPAQAGAQQEIRDERRDGKSDRSDRSVKPNANAVWVELSETFEHHGVPVPEIHPKERNDRIHALLKQLPRPDPKLLDQVLFIALAQHESLKSADNPLGYLQKMLKDPVTKQALLASVAEAERPAA